MYSAIGAKPHHAWPLPLTWPMLLETQAAQWVLLDELQADLQRGKAALCSNVVNAGVTLSI